MATAVGICNQALAFIKEKPILALDADSVSARACSEAYDEHRRQLLSMANWNFARARRKLSRLSAAPGFGPAYAFRLPAGFIRVIGLWSDAQATVPIRVYSIEDGAILCDAEDAYLAYVFDQEDPNRMTPLFRRALSRYIAITVAVSIANSRTLASDMQALFDQTDLPRARSQDAIEDGEEPMPDSEWVTCRY